VSDRIIEELKGLKSHFDQNTGSLAEQIDEIGKKAGNVDDKVVELKNKYDAERQEMLAEFSEYKSKVESRIDELEAENGRPGVGVKGFETPGTRFSESENFKSLVARNGMGANGVSAPVQSFLSKANSNILNSARTSEWGALGHLIPYHELGTFEAGRRELRVRDLLNVVRTSSDTVRYVSLGNFRNVFTTVVSGGASGTATVTVANTEGFFAGQNIVAGTQSRVIQGVNTGTKVITVTSNFTSSLSAGDAVVSDEIPATVAGGVKPRANWGGPTVTTKSISTIAHWIAIHRQTLQDVPQVRDLIDTDLVYGLRLNEEYQILRGDGLNDNLQGLIGTTGVQNAGTSGSAAANIDFIRQALTLAELAMYPVDAVLMHPTNWQNFELMKDSTGRYLLSANPVDGPVNVASRQIWRVPVISTVAMTAGQFLMGAFRAAAYLLDREDANVRVAEQHAEYFTSNMVAILAEERLGLAVPRPEALIKGTLA
jgi:hypothetical protein